MSEDSQPLLRPCTAEDITLKKPKKADKSDAVQSKEEKKRKREKREEKEKEDIVADVATRDHGSRYKFASHDPSTPSRLVGMGSRIHPIWIPWEWDAGKGR